MGNPKWLRQRRLDVRVLVVVLLFSLAGCSAPEPTLLTPGPEVPRAVAWNGTAEAIHADTDLWTLDSAWGNVSLRAHGGALVCSWTLKQGLVSQCLVDDVVLVSTTQVSGTAALMQGAPVGAFVFSHVVLDANMTEVFRSDHLVPAPRLGSLIFDYMEACAPSWFGTSQALPTYGRFRVDAVGGRIDATWRAPDFTDAAYVHGGTSSQLALLADGATVTVDADPLTKQQITVAIQAAPQIETGISQTPSSQGECDNILHGESIAWPLRFAWTPWHGAPLDLSQDVPFQVWQVLF